MDAHASESIRAAHTILDTAAIVKELVENALDAGATRVDVRLRGKAGLDSIVVSDNGKGISTTDHATICLSSTTSKLRHDSDMTTDSFTTFGFRGEALAAIRRVCAALSIVTRNVDDQNATTLTFAVDGSLAQSTPAARPVGTTVSVSRVFHTLPVRRKDAISNAHRELARCIGVVQALAIISVHARVELRVANDLKVRSTGHSSVAATPRQQLNEFTLASLRASAQSVLGTRAAAALMHVEKCTVATVTIPPAFRNTNNGPLQSLACGAEQPSETFADNNDEKKDSSDDETKKHGPPATGTTNTPTKTNLKAVYQCMGLVSRASLDADGSGGRARSSHHYIFVNERPVDFPRVARAANEVYRRATGLASASPALILNFIMPTWACDVNLAPDKRHVLVHDEDALLAGVVKMLELIWIPTAEAAIPLQKSKIKQQSSILSAFSRSTESATPAATPTSQRDGSLDTPEAGPGPVPCSGSPVGALGEQDQAVNQDKAEEQSVKTGNEDENNDDVIASKAVKSRLEEDVVKLPSIELDSCTVEQQAHPAQQNVNDGNPSNDQSKRARRTPDWEADSPALPPRPQPAGHAMLVSDTDVQPPLISSDKTDVERAAHSKDISAFVRGMPYLSSEEQDAKPRLSEILNRLKRSSGTKRRRVGDFVHSDEEILSTDWSQKSHREVLEMTSKRRTTALQATLGRRSILEYAGQRPKRVNSIRNSFLLGSHDVRCECCPTDAETEPTAGEKLRRGRGMQPPPFPAESRIRHHDPTLQNGGNNANETTVDENRHDSSSPPQEPVDIVMDGIADDDIELNAGRIKPQFVLQVDWDDFFGDSSDDDDNVDQVQQKDGADDAVGQSTGFEKASMAGSGESSEIEAADRELSRLFRQEWFKQLRVIGQFNRGFIVGQLGREVFIIDQHASDEKYNYERLQATTQLQRQALVMPRRLEMSAEDELIVVQYLKVLNASGYDIRYHASNVPTNRLTLHSQPVSKHIVFGEDDLFEIVYMLKSGFYKNGTEINNGNGSSNISGSSTLKIKPPRVQAMLASRACRKSIMIGTALHRREMKQVLENLSGILHPWTCPHGRPTMRHLCTLPSPV